MSEGIPKTEDSDRYNVPLSRTIGLTSGILLVAGIMIGSGVFKKIVPMAASGLSEKYIIAAWVVAGIITMFGAFTVAGLSTLTTTSGGEYEYLRLIFGNFVSFLFGWSSFTIMGSASIAAIAVVFTSSVNELLHLGNPFASLEHLSAGYIVDPFADSGLKLLAVATIMLLTWVNYRGTTKATKLNNLITYAKVAGILLLISIGLFYGGKGQVPLETAIVPITGTGGTGAFFAAMLSAFWAYDGWINVTFISGEIKNPTHNLPRAVISGVLLVIILYVLVNFAFMKILPVKVLASLGDNEIAATVMVKSVLGESGKVLITLLIMLSTFGALNGLITTYSRLYYQMSVEGFFFKKVSKVHPRFNTPYVSLIYSMLISCLLVFSGSFDLLTDLVIFAGFLFYALLAWGLIKMKRRGLITSNLIGYPVVPVIFILFSIALLVNTIITQPMQTFAGIILMLTGVPFYFYFKRKKNCSQS